ncbi:D-lactate dehydrogenase [Pseudoxanthomonas sp.]|uniref:D-lactate dehydrogenase n=1 Tax=Pseudoxanthomonas sp. TaxID=1871049 RepID=UPI0025CDF4C6|nr:D-lactate dehydrogenase [Pseudoxanthomonas sp.]
MPLETIPDDALLARLREVVGRRHVLTGARATRRYRKGYRFGDGPVLAVACPGTLLELWRVLQATVDAGRIVLMQAANTGLTGGSTPDGEGYDRSIVLISTRRLTGVQLLEGGRQVVCLPGATLDVLEKTLAPLGREPHSVIGSSCIGASVLGGVCNNSGGALVRRGPAYTELALYAQRGDDGVLRLVNHLGIALGETPEEILSRLQAGDYGADAIVHDPAQAASDPCYADHVREVDAPTPARYNADPSRLHEASGCAGRLAVFAVRLDTFERDDASVFYIGSNDPDDLTEVRRHLLTAFERLPIAGEYLHRDAFDIGDRYGKDTFLLIDRFGTDKVPAAFALKSRVDGVCERFGMHGLADRALQWFTAKLPDHLPPRLRAYRDRYEHHLLLKVSTRDAEATRAFLHGFFGGREGDFLACDAEEGRKAFLLRFAVAGAAVRYRAVHAAEVEDIVALDIALRRDDRAWVETLPAALATTMVARLYYGHFFCHVFHQDYIVRKGVDPLAVEHRLWDLLDARGAEYPAEHNVGHLYRAKPALADFYRMLDPTNTFNPGIGQTSRQADWKE